jgi:hypothetical protein
MAIRGITARNGAQDNTIGPGNTIAFNVGNGVEVYEVGTFGINITQNSIYQNGGSGISLFDHGNNDLLKPSITGITRYPVEVSGTACAGCQVEVFGNPDREGEGKVYLETGAADASGFFTITVSGSALPYLTVTATDPISGTSRFSNPFAVGGLYLPLVVKGP